MIWILVFAAFVVASVFGARWVLANVEPFVGAGLLPQSLVYAAAVVVAGNLTATALSINQLWDGGPEFGGHRTQTAVDLVARALPEIAWQAGLLVTAAALVARRSTA